MRDVIERLEEILTKLKAGEASVRESRFIMEAPFTRTFELKYVEHSPKKKSDATELQPEDLRRADLDELGY